MLIVRLYYQNKWLFVIVLALIATQLFINYKHGATLSPFYHYGMYSEIIHERDVYQIFEVEQNGKKLLGQEFSPQEWDKILLPLQYYAGINASNTMYLSNIKRLLLKIGISTNDTNFIVDCNYDEFENWYKKYLDRITGKNTRQLVIGVRAYKFYKGKLQATDSVTMLSQLCR